VSKWRPRFPIRNGPMVDIETGHPTRDWREFLDRVFSTLGWDTNKKLWAVQFMAAMEMQELAAYTQSNPTGTIRFWNLSPSSTSVWYGGRTLPNNYKDGTDIIPFMVWMPDDAAAGDVRLRYAAAIPNANGSMSETLLYATAPTPEVTNKRVTTEFSALDGANLRKGDPVVVGTARLGGDAADTYPEECYFIGAGFKYQAEGLGTPEAFP